MLRKRVAKKIVHGDGIGKKILHITIPEKNSLPAVNHPPQKLNGRPLTILFFKDIYNSKLLVTAL
jgi:hypothetical protein